MGHTDDEQKLTGGNVTTVVRVGDTVRRPTGPWTPAVHALLRHLERAGFDGAPRVLGTDEHGREVLEFVPGVTPWESRHAQLLGTVEAVARAGRLLHRFHDAVSDFEVPADAVWRYADMATDAVAFAPGDRLIVCHNDATAWNLVIGPNRWALVDWDAAGPRPAIWDLAYAAIGILPVAPDASGLGWSAAVPVADRLVALADGYGLSGEDRARLPDAIAARIASSYEGMRRRAEAGEDPWPELWNGGHGRAWADMLSEAERQRDAWLAALESSR